LEHVPPQRLCEFIAPTDTELQALKELIVAKREYRRKETIACQGQPVTEVLLLTQGCITSSMDADDGRRRQIFKLHFPGDLVGLPSIAFREAAETLVAATLATVGVIPVERLGRLFERAPRLAFTLFLSTQQERVMLMDHLAAVGHTSARQRISALLLHVHRRLKLFDPAGSSTFLLPLSQTDMADAAGLTPIHVNRTIGELKRAKLIAVKGKWVTLLDIERLTAIAALPERVPVWQPLWLTDVAQCGITAEQ